MGLLLSDGGCSSIVIVGVPCAALGIRCGQVIRANHQYHDLWHVVYGKLAVLDPPPQVVRCITCVIVHN